MGCISHIDDTGIQYYRPKPYLLVSPAGVTVSTESSDGGTKTVITTGESDRFVHISLQYVPDFGEEYSITVRSGLGVNNTTITLQDGRNLTSINQQLDSRFDENVKAVAELVKAAGGLAGAGVGNGQGRTLPICDCRFSFSTALRTRSCRPAEAGLSLRKWPPKTRRSDSMRAAFITHLAILTARKCWQMWSSFWISTARLAGLPEHVCHVSVVGRQAAGRFGRRLDLSPIAVACAPC